MENKGNLLNSGYGFEMDYELLLRSRIMSMLGI